MIQLEHQRRVIWVHRVLTASDFSNLGRLIRSNKATAAAKRKDTNEKQREPAGSEVK